VRHWAKLNPASNRHRHRSRPPGLQVVKARMQQEKEEAWRAMASASHGRPRTETTYPWKLRQTSAIKLGAWELVELKRLLLASDPGKTGFIRRDDLIAATVAMETRGRRLVKGSPSSPGTSGAGASKLEDAAAALDQAMAALDKGDGRISW
jgi:hypothetical protein